MSSVAIIGAGIGGLATAVRAAAEGRKVTVFEASPEVGGKLRQLHLDGYRFDLGPSLFTWPDLLLDTLEKAGAHAAPFRFTQLDRSCHYFWPDGTQFKAWSDKSKLSEEIQSAFGVDPQPVLEHLERSSAGFEATKGIFLEQSLHEASSWSPQNTFRQLGAAWRGRRGLPLTQTLRFMVLPFHE